MHLGDTMTQEVQPLDYVHRTNIEEHKQFHDKINEIVANLAPTVDRADQLLQQVKEQSAQVANAVTTADTASTQAQAAAATALGIGDRVTEVENAAARNHSDITVLDGEVTDINNDLTNVVRKVTSDVQKVNKGLRVGEVPAGDDVVISRKVLKDFVDAYEHMIRTTGNQVKRGIFKVSQTADAPTELVSNLGMIDISWGGNYTRPLSIKNSFMKASHGDNPSGRSWIYVNGVDDEPLFLLQFDCDHTETASTRSLKIRIWDGVKWVQTTLASAPYAGD